eukprot:scaffold1248_cov170-Amphora_coffeaeformis.AAC.4
MARKMTALLLIVGDEMMQEQDDELDEIRKALMVGHSFSPTDRTRQQYTELPKNQMFRISFCDVTSSFHPPSS